MKVHTVKVHRVATGETFGADKALMDQVKTCSGLRVKEAEQQEADVVVLFCPVSSRVGTDVEAAVANVSGNV